MAISVDSRVAGKKLPNLEILVGTYEEFVLGFKLKENTEGVSLVDSFFGFQLLDWQVVKFFRAWYWFKVLQITVTVEAFAL